MLFTGIPALSAVLLYKKNPVSDSLKYYIVIGYFVMYIFVMITGNTPLIFTYIFPMLSLVVLYQKKNLILGMGIAAFLVNILFILIRAFQHQITMDNSKDIEIQLALIFLCFSGSYIAAELYGNVTEKNREYTKMLDEKTKEIQKMTFQAITVIANTIDAKDEYTKGHSQRVSEYSYALAKELGLEEKEAQNIRNIALAANKLGIKVLTLYAFSTENWARPTDEVNYLMRLPIDFFDKFMPELMENNVRVNIMGFVDELPEKTYLVTQKAMAETANNTGMVLNFAFNYGSRREITAGVQEIARKVKVGEIDIDDISEKMVSDHLLTHSLAPYEDPDLLIRTSGEERLSNFLLWQMAYTEFSFSDKLWPDFDKTDLEELVKDYQGRNRRFGKV